MEWGFTLCQQKKGNPLSLAEGVAGATALTMANSMFE